MQNTAWLNLFTYTIPHWSFYLRIIFHIDNSIYVFSNKHACKCSQTMKETSMLNDLIALKTEIFDITVMHLKTKCDSNVNCRQDEIQRYNGDTCGTCLLGLGLQLTRFLCQFRITRVQSCEHCKTFWPASFYSNFSHIGTHAPVHARILHGFR